MGAKGSHLFWQEYGYDKAGNLVKKQDTVFGTDKFYYDPMGRIIRQIDPTNQIKKFLYDPAGDRLTTRVSEEVSDESKLAWKRVGEFEGSSYWFDRLGNLVERKGAKEETRFNWDANQRLIESIKDGKSTVYRYDPLGRRISKETDAVRTRFVWDGDALLGDIHEAGATIKRIREWVYYPGTFEPLAMQEATISDRDTNSAKRIYYYANEPNGCPSRLIDESGKIVWAARYDIFGNTLKFQVNEVDQPLRLQGQFYDEETGLHYNRYRLYDPQIGCFISRDPLGLYAGENLYGFLPNTQVWIDPWGLIIVYRALNGHQETDALAGRTIQPKDINASYTIQEHIDDGNLRTQYISTTKKINTAEFYAKENPRRGKLTKSTIVEIDTDKLAPGKVFDVSSGIDPQTGRKLFNPGYRYATKDSEVLITGAIPSHAYKKKGC